MDLDRLHLHVKNIYYSKAFYIKFIEFKEKVNYVDLLFLENEYKFDLALQPDNEVHVFPIIFILDLY